jgi:hypothetical protein
VPSRHTQFSEDFTTNIAESNFRYTQRSREQEINSAARTLGQHRRFYHPINADKVFGTHKGRENAQQRGKYKSVRYARPQERHRQQFYISAADPPPRVEQEQNHENQQ